MFHFYISWKRQKQNIVLKWVNHWIQQVDILEDPSLITGLKWVNYWIQQVDISEDPFLVTFLTLYQPGSYTLQNC